MPVKQGKQSTKGAQSRPTRDGQSGSDVEIKPKSFMDCFYALADVNTHIRHAAALDLVSHVRRGGEAQDKLDYCLKRLVRGLASSNGCARQGFCLALTRLLQEKADDQDTFMVESAASVLNLVKAECAVQRNQRGQEERDLLLGSMFGAVAIARSGRASTDGSEVALEAIKVALESGDRKDWLNQLAVEIIASLLNVTPVSQSATALPLSETEFCEQLLTLLESWLPDEDTSADQWSPEQLQLVCVLRSYVHTNPALGEWLEQSAPEWAARSAGPVRDVKTMSLLLPSLRESARYVSGVHAVWHWVISELLTDTDSASSETLLSSFWRVIICGSDGLLCTTHQRRVLAYRIAQELFERDSLEPTLQASLCTAPFLKSLATHMAAVDSHSHRAAMRTAASIRTCASKSMQHRLAMLNAILASDPQFDTHATLRLTKAGRRRRKRHGKNQGLVQGLLQGLDAEAAAAYVSKLRQAFLGIRSAAGEMTAEAAHHHRTLACEALYAAAKNESMPGHADWYESVVSFLFAQGFFRCKSAHVDACDAALRGDSSAHGAESPLRSLCASRAVTLITGRAIEEYKDQAQDNSMHGAMGSMHKLWKKLEKAGTRPLHPLSEDAQKARKLVNKMLKAVKRLQHNALARSLTTLILASELQLLLPDTMEEASRDISDLSALCDGGFFASGAGESDDASSAGTPSQVMIDLILSLQTRAHSPCHKLLRDSAKSVFASLCALHYIDDECVETLLTPLEQSTLIVGGEVDSAEEQGEDGEDFAPIDPEEFKRIQERLQLNSEDEQEDVVITSASELAKILTDEQEAQVSGKVDNDPGTDNAGNSTSSNDDKSSSSSGDSDSDGDSDDDSSAKGSSHRVHDVDNDEIYTSRMIEAFKMLSKSSKKAEARMLQQQDMNFKLRVADLVDVWLRRHVTSIAAPATLLMVFLRTIVDLTLKQQQYLASEADESKSSRKRNAALRSLEKDLAERLRALLTKRLFASKAYPRGTSVASPVAVETLHHVMGECVALASATQNSDLAELATNALVYILKVLRGTQPDGSHTSKADQSVSSWGLLNQDLLSSALVDKALRDYLKRKNSRLSESFFSTLIKRSPRAASVLVAPLCEAIQTPTKSGSKPDKEQPLWTCRSSFYKAACLRLLAAACAYGCVDEATNKNVGASVLSAATAVVDEMQRGSKQGSTLVNSLMDACQSVAQLALPGDLDGEFVAQLMELHTVAESAPGLKKRANLRSRVAKVQSLFSKASSSSSSSTGKKRPPTSVDAQEQPSRPKKKSKKSKSKKKKSKKR